MMAQRTQRLESCDISVKFCLTIGSSWLNVLFESPSFIETIDRPGFLKSSFKRGHCCHSTFRYAFEGEGKNENFSVQCMCDTLDLHWETWFLGNAWVEVNLQFLSFVMIHREPYSLDIDTYYTLKGAKEPALTATPSFSLYHLN